MSAVPLAVWDGEPVEELRAAWGVAHLEAYATIASTNDRALALASEGGERPAAVVADAQTAGRGRRGARWHAAPGEGLLLSLLLDSRGPPDGPLPLLVGLVVADAIEALAPELEVSLKWPNDLLIRGAKVAGVLCEAARGGVVVGVGVNVRVPAEPPPDGLDQGVTSLETHARRPLSRSVLASLICDGIEALEREAGPVLSPVRRAELARRDALLGRPVRTEVEGEGTAVGIAPDGALLLLRSDGVRARVVAGGVRLR